MEFEIFKILLKHVSDHLSVLLQFVCCTLNYAQGFTCSHERQYNFFGTFYLTAS